MVRTNFVIHGVLLAHSWSVPKCGTSKDGNTYLTCLDTVMEHFSGIAALAHGLLGDFLLCSTLGLLCREKCEVDRGLGLHRIMLLRSSRVPPD